MKIERNIDYIKKIFHGETIDNNEDLEIHNKEKFEDLTVIIPSHNRHNYIERSIRYYRIFESIKFIYVDSSDLKYEIQNKYNNIEYIYVPGYSFVNKMIYVLNQVKTTYICTCADDDFLVLDELVNGYAFMKNNPNYILYYGSSWSLIKDNKSIRLIRNRTNKRNIIGKEKERAYSFFKNYLNVLWSLSKRDVLLKGFEMLNEAKFSNDNFYEITLGTNFAFNGDIYISSNVWNVRDMTDFYASWGRRHKSLLGIKKDNKIKDDYNKFIKITNKELDFNYGEYAFKVYYVYGNKLNPEILKRTDESLF